jgi:GT2 family glycosyltransferase
MKKSEKPINNTPKVAIILLNWNGWEDTIECLESLFKVDYPNYEILVLDNKSTNESIQKIKNYAKGEIRTSSKYFQYDPKNKPIKIKEYTEDMINEILKSESETKQIVEKKSKELKEEHAQESAQEFIFIMNNENHGFAKGNNIGMKYAKTMLSADYILLLNNDTVVERDFLTHLIKAAKQNKSAGIIAPKIPYYDKPDKNWFGWGKINWFSINIAYHISKIDEKIIQSDYITGCAALIRTDVIDKIGYLNEKLFLYFEDADYSLRAKAKGFELIVVPDAVVYHKVSATSYTFTLSNAQYYFSRNRLWFVKKYCPKKYLRLSLMFIILRLFLAAGFFTLKRERSTVKAIMKAYRDGLNTSFLR